MAYTQRNGFTNLAKPNQPRTALPLPRLICISTNQSEKRHHNPDSRPGPIQQDPEISFSMYEALLQWCTLFKTFI